MKKNKIFESYFKQNHQIYKKILEKNINLHEAVEQKDNTFVANVQAFLWRNNFVHNPKKKSKEDWIDGRIGSEYRESVRIFQRYANKNKLFDAGTNNSVDGKVGDGTKSAIKNFSKKTTQKKPSEQDPEQSGALRKTLEIEKIDQVDSKIGEAIKKLTRAEIRDSKLYYDGNNLFWMLGNKPIRKWEGSSGKYDNLIDNPWLARVMVNTIKKLQNEKNRPADEVISDLRTFVEYAPSLNPEDVQETVWLSHFDAKNIYKAFKTNNRSEIMKEFEYIFDKYNIDEFMPASEKRKASAQKSYGPIPEGEYKIIHKLQHLPKNAAINPTFYDTMYVAMANHVGSKNPKLLPYEKISEEEFEKVIGSKMDLSSSLDAFAKMKEAVDWGNFRLRITKMSPRASKIVKYRGAGYNKRDGFMIHGGFVRGSSGCIDLGEGMDSFAKFWTVAGVGKAVDGGGRPGSLQRMRFSIPLIVKYSDDAKEELITKNRVAKKFAKVIFKSPGGEQST